MSRAAPLALLDVATGKTACLVLGDDGRLLGGAHAGSAGLKAGEVTDPDIVTAVIARTLEAAVGRAGVAVRDVALAVNCGRLACSAVKAAVSLDPTIVRPFDVDRLTTSLAAYATKPDRHLLHLQRHRFVLDGVASAAPPLERFGRTLSVDAAVVTADVAPLARLLGAVRAAGLRAVQLIPAPLAAGLAVTDANERQAGVTVIDFGAGTTGYAMFAGGHIVGIGTVAMGGQALTHDLAEALGCPLTQAERIKTICGRDPPAPADETPTGRLDSGPDTERPLVAERDERFDDTTRAALRHAIDRRLGTLLRLIIDRIDAEPFALAGAQRVVITGGASQLAGLDAEAERLWGRPVRRRSPIGHAVSPAVAAPQWAVIEGMRRAVGTPGFGVAVADEAPQWRARA